MLYYAVIIIIIYCQSQILGEGGNSMAALSNGAEAEANAQTVVAAYFAVSKLFSFLSFFCFQFSLSAHSC